jgi:hypothetical protein
MLDYDMPPYHTGINLGEEKNTGWYKGVKLRHAQRHVNVHDRDKWFGELELQNMLAKNHPKIASPQTAPRNLATKVFFLSNGLENPDGPRRPRLATATRRHELPRPHPPAHPRRGPSRFTATNQPAPPSLSSLHDSKASERASNGRHFTSAPRVAMRRWSFVLR